MPPVLQHHSIQSTARGTLFLGLFYLARSLFHRIRAEFASISGFNDGVFMLVLSMSILLVILAAAGKAALLTLLTGGGIGTFVVLFFLFKMFGK